MDVVEKNSKSFINDFIKNDNNHPSGDYQYDDYLKSDIQSTIT